MAEKPHRRLAAIVMADVVGYSALIQRDEVGTRAVFNKIARNLVKPLCNKHKGRIFKTMGDAFLMEFSSVLNAVVCAIELQQQIKLQLEDEVSMDLRALQFRIGVNMGDIVVEGDDIHGEGVNVVARLQGFAVPGGLCISENTFGQVDGKVGVTFKDGGRVELKNISGKAQIYLWSPTDRQTPQQNSQQSRQPARSPIVHRAQTSIAILPFRNINEDPEQLFFSEGITEDLITELSRFSELDVKARSTSFSFKDPTASMQEIGEKLDVSYLVEGSVRRAGKRVRVAVQLISVTDGSHVWAERYDRSIEDLFDVQDEIVRAIVSILPTRLLRAQELKIRHKSPEELSAYEHFLHGRWLHVNSSGTDSRSLIYLNKAVEIFPQHAQSHAWMACIYAYNLFSLGIQYDDPESKSRSFIDKALKYGMSDPTVRSLVAETLYYLGESSLARHHINAALELNPHNVEFKILNGAILSGAGLSEEAFEIMTQAMAVEPLTTHYAQEWVIECLFLLGRYNDSLELILSWQNPPPHTYAQKAACYAYLGDTLQAEAAAQQFRAVCADQADFERYAHNHARICQLEKDKENWLGGYRKAGLMT